MSGGILNSGVPFNKYEQANKSKFDVAYAKPENVNSEPLFGTIVNMVKHPTGLLVYIAYDHVPPSEITRDSIGVALPLAHTIDEIAAVYGDSLIGLRCKVESKSGRPDSGLVYIIDTKGSGDLETAHKLPGYNTFLAPAGNMAL